MRPREITVPDQLWTNRSLTEGARFLWCYLLAVRPERRQFTYFDLRKETGLCQNSLVKHLKELEEAGWLRCRRTGLRSLECKAIWHKATPSGAAAIRLPTDLILDRTLPRPARWVWGVVRRIKGRFNYALLTKLTGYSHNSLIKYLGQLQSGGLMKGSACRVARRKAFDLAAVNPAGEKRREEARRLWRAIGTAADQPGYSKGQCIMARGIELLIRPGILMLENGVANWLANPETWAHMQYDVCLPDQRTAFEFQGEQHARPTKRFPDEAEFRARQKRDQLKRDLSRQYRFRLYEVWARELRMDYLRELLEAAGVPLRENLDEVWHLYEVLERAMAEYRASADLVA